MRWFPLLLLLGCETNEVRAWSERHADLERRKAELTELEARGPEPRIEVFRHSLDLAAFIREHGAGARLFVEPGVVRLGTSGTVRHCRETVAALADLRWLTQEWRLRLENGRCDWEARTGKDFATLEDALVAPPSKWAAPPSQLFSRGMPELKTKVEALEREVIARETRLGAQAVLQGKLDAMQPLIDSLHARPEPCDLAVLDRELAQAEADQGALLEVERSRLVHPLEPLTDYRLRGLVEVHDGIVAWHCEPL